MQNKKEEGEKREEPHFIRKALWKETKGGRFNPEEPNPMDGTKLSPMKSPGGLILDWA